MKKTLNSAQSPPAHKTRSPLQTLGIFVPVAFAAELMIMFFLDFAGINGPFSNVIAAALLTVLILPALIYLVYKPLAAEAEFQQRMKNELKVSHDILLTVLDGLDAVVYVADLKTYELLFLNKFAREIFGDSVGKICWQVLQKGQYAPCDFCSNSELISENGQIKRMYAWEFQNTVNKHWYDIRDRAIPWIDGRLARLEIATDITDRKKAEEEREKLINKLGKKIVEVTVLQGIVPICSHCKKIRDDEGYWKQVDEYISKHTGAQFSHSICPTCMQENFPEYDE